MSACAIIAMSVLNIRRRKAIRQLARIPIQLLHSPSAGAAQKRKLARYWDLYIAAIGDTSHRSRDPTASFGYSVSRTADDFHFGV
jgi:hypothetical protein